MTTFRRWDQAWVWLLVGSALLPFAGYHLVIPLAAWLAPIFLLRFVRTAPSARVALVLVFVATAASILVNMRGGQATGFDLVVALVMMPLVRGVLYTLPYAADRALAARMAAWPRLLVFPLAWTSLDWLMSLLNATGTFGSPAYSQADLLVLVQVVSVTGMWGLTFLIAWGASSANAVWERGWRRRASYRWASPFVAVFIAVLAFGSLRLGMPAQAPRTVIATIALDQAVMDRASSGIDWATFNRAPDAQRAAARLQFAETTDDLFTHTEIALRQGARLVGWSEGAGLVLEEDVPGTIERAAVLARQYDAYLQLGLGIPTRTPSWPFIRNVSILVDSNGTVRWVYDKTHPVVGSEALTTIRGAGILPFADTPYGLLSTAICNDLGYPELLRQAGQGHADVLLAPTHDVPPNAIPDAAEARYRAVENGFALVRPAALGYSLVTDAYGRTISMQDNTSTSATSVLEAAIPTRGVATVYSLFGDWLAYASVVGLLGLTVSTFAGRRRPRPVPSLQPAQRAPRMNRTLEES